MKKWILVVFMSSLTLQAKVSFEQKSQWLQQLQSCSADCADLALDILEKYTRDTPLAKSIIRPNAKATLLYLHSFTMNPSELSLFHSQVTKNRDLNFIAPVFTAHELDSKPEDFIQVKPSQWLLDSELALHLAFALGKPVILQGYSMGGMAAIGLAQRYPDKIAKLLLISPALLISNGGDDWACMGQLRLVQSLLKKFSGFENDPENSILVEKFLSGGCSLAKMIGSVRNRFSTRQYFSHGNHDVAASKFYSKIDQIEQLGASIKTKTLIIYSEYDEVIDSRAIDKFSQNLPDGKSIVFTGEKEKISHLYLLQELDISGVELSIRGVKNRDAFTQDEIFQSTYTAMKKFISEK